MTATDPQSELPFDAISTLAGTGDGTKTASLVGAILAGSDYARSQLSALYLPAVTAAIRRWVRREQRPAVRYRLEQESEEMVNDVLINALKAIADAKFAYRGAGSLSAWLNTAVRNRVIDRARFWERRAELPPGAGGDGDSAAQMPDDGPGPRTQVERRERLERVMAELARLPEEDQLLVELHVWHGLTYADVVVEFMRETQVELSEDAARHRCQRALAELGRRLRELGS
ncbi:MAG: sigma-70 family RNA polymerase sigma factor [Planctomycetes bacterium]|nr:sigma-70 family RNA polymerase sigma factor [Planctomycetota bacterium]